MIDQMVEQIIFVDIFYEANAFMVIDAGMIIVF
jgi:hypothetical protein